MNKLIFICFIVCFGKINRSDAAPTANAEPEAEPEPFFNPLGLIFSLQLFLPGKYEDFFFARKIHD